MSHYVNIVSTLIKYAFYIKAEQESPWAENPHVHHCLKKDLFASLKLLEEELFTQTKAWKAYAQTLKSSTTKH